MPNIKGQIKREKQNVKIKLSNKQKKSNLRTVYKNTLKLEKSNSNNDKINSTISLVNKAVSKGLIKQNTAARMNSKLSKKIN